MSNISGTITTGGTAQQLVAFPPATNPRGFWICNLDATTTLYVRDDGDPADTTESIPVPPGALYESPSFWPVGQPAPSVSVYSTKTGHAFSAEWY